MSNGCEHGNLTAHGRDCPWCRIARLLQELEATREIADELRARNELLERENTEMHELNTNLLEEVNSLTLMVEGE